MKQDNKSSVLWGENKHLCNNQTTYALILVYYAIKTAYALKIY